MSAGARSGARPLPTVPLARALAALRVFVGVIAFSNGLAKLLSFRAIEVGPYFGTLIDRPESRQILDFEVNRRAVLRRAHLRFGVQVR
jgi:hypothetical protein